MSDKEEKESRKADRIKEATSKGVETSTARELSDLPEGTIKEDDSLNCDDLLDRQVTVHSIIERESPQYRGTYLEIACTFMGEDRIWTTGARRIVHKLHDAEPYFPVRVRVVRTGNKYDIV